MLTAAVTLPLAACVGDRRPVPPTEPRGPSLSIGFGWEDVVEPDTDWAGIVDRLDRVGVHGVTIGVGRPEFVAFPWAGYEDRWAGPWSEERDPVRRAIDALQPRGPRRDRTVTLTVDVASPVWIEENPELGAQSLDGEINETFPSAAALHSGRLREGIVALCGAVAERYTPDRVALTELLIEESFGEADLELFREMTGEEDWPRTGGEIDTDAEVLSDWRSEIVAGVVAECHDAVSPHGALLDTDIRSPVQDASRSRRESGHDDALLLEAGDRLTVWNYFALDGNRPEWSEKVTVGMAQRLGDGIDLVTMSVGLWTSGEEALPPDQMVAGLEHSLTNGVDDVSVTPHSMLTGDHWQALEEWWSSRS